ncbi:glycosyltransferase family 9 protein [bacterium]|nr:glycosyltransferase family 9 protein [bacterium]
MTGNKRNFLVCRTDALGDTILTIPVCTALKKAFPHAHIAMLVAPYTADIVDQHPDIDQVLVNDAQLPAKLKTEKIDTALAVFPDLRVSWALWRAGIQQRVGTSRRWWSFLYNVHVKHSRAKAERHEAEYNLDLVRAIGAKAELQTPKLFVQPEAGTWAETFYQQREVREGDKLVIVHPGGRGSAANWEAEQYGQLTNMLMQELSCKVLVTGSNNEQKRLHAVAKYCQKPPLLLDQPVTLKQLAALLQRAKVVVAGNTGPLHLAAALEVPVVTVFPPTGVTGPIRWGPLGKCSVVLTPPENRQSMDLKLVRPRQVLNSIKSWLRES